MSDEIILGEVRSLGVADPLHASAATVKTVLGAYLTQRVLSESSLNRYLYLLNPSLEVLMDGFKAFSLDQAGLSHKTQETIRVAINALSTRLGDPKIGEREVHEIRIAILALVREARDESSEQRVYSLGFAALAASAFLAALGGLLAVTDGNRRLPFGKRPALPFK